MHRKHLDIFGYIFPPEIHNWYCDNYMKELYDKGHSNWMWEYKHINAGGQPRYEPTKPDDKNISLTPDKANILQKLGHQGLVDSDILYKKLAKRDKEKIENFIQTYYLAIVNYYIINHHESYQGDRIVWRIRVTIR